jgi:hypothetical protein
MQKEHKRIRKLLRRIHKERRGWKCWSTTLEGSGKIYSSGTVHGLQLAIQMIKDLYKIPLRRY